MKENSCVLAKYLNFILWIIAGLLAIVVIGMLVSTFIAKSISISTFTLGLLNLSFLIILVFVTIIYVILTGRIVAETKNDRKVAIKEKTLENLYTLRHDLRCRKNFWVIGDNNHYQLNTDKIKFQFAYLFPPSLNYKLELLIKKLVAADNEKEPKMMPWELDYVKSTTIKTLLILEDEIKKHESDLNKLIG